MRVDELPIADSVKEIIIETGISELYPPQEEAIKRGALEGKNLVLASPTASGKTLIAELCALKKILEEGGKVVYLTPLRALASEKYEEFKKYERIGREVRVAISTGDYDSLSPWLERYNLIVLTNEKADSLLRHRAHWIKEISLIVADEVHLLQDPERGPTLEVILARLRQVNPRAQVLALSATIKNADEIAEWLNAESITTNWRPVMLKEGVCLSETVKLSDGDSYMIEEEHKEPSINLATNILKQKGQALIFAGTRKKAVSLAKKASSVVKKFLSKSDRRILKSIAEKILSTGERTRMSDLLSELISCGAAFHHAGLNPSHRKIIEDSFREGKIKVLAATPTLAFGVNLPARLVVVRDYERYAPGWGYYPIPVLEYKQMAGRAGRPRYDKIGEALLVAKTPDELDYLMREYVLAEPERIWSKLGVERALRSHVLATLAAGFAHTEQGVYDFFERTFYAFQYGLREIKRTIKDVLSFLQKEKMIEVKGNDIIVTRFGRRISELYIDPLSGVILRDGFAAGAENPTHRSFLHLVCHTPDMDPKFAPRRKDMGELYTYLDIHRSEFMAKIPDEWEDPVAFEEFLVELNTARVLESWMEELREDDIIARHGVESGDLFRLVENADWLLYSSYELAKLFGYKNFLPELAILRERIQHGVKAELLPLVRLKGIGRVRGRMLFNSGLKTVEDLKRASLADLMKIPTIGPKLAREIKEQVGGLVKREEWERIKAEKGEQRILTEF